MVQLLGFWCFKTSLQSTVSWHTSIKALTSFLLKFSYGQLNSNRAAICCTLSYVLICDSMIFHLNTILIFIKNPFLFIDLVHPYACVVWSISVYGRGSPRKYAGR